MVDVLGHATQAVVWANKRKIKDATVKRFHHDSHDQLCSYLADFISTYNFACRFKIIRGLTPYEFICEIRTCEPERFIPNPMGYLPGLNI